jgi:hypothetical protein
MGVYVLLVALYSSSFGLFSRSLPAEFFVGQKLIAVQFGFSVAFSYFLKKPFLNEP